jgi:hypothetical protein
MAKFTCVALARKFPSYHVVRRVHCYLVKEEAADEFRGKREPVNLPEVVVELYDWTAPYLQEVVLSL